MHFAIEIPKVPKLPMLPGARSTKSISGIIGRVAQKGFRGSPQWFAQCRNINRSQFNPDYHITKLENSTVVKQYNIDWKLLQGGEKIYQT